MVSLQEIKGLSQCDGKSWQYSPVWCHVRHPAQVFIPHDHIVSDFWTNILPIYYLIYQFGNLRASRLRKHRGQGISTPRYIGKEFLYGNYRAFDLNSKRLFQWRRMERVSGGADARRDVKLESHGIEGIVLRTGDRTAKDTKRQDKDIFHSVCLRHGVGPAMQGGPSFQPASKAAQNSERDLGSRRRLHGIPSKWEGSESDL